MTYPVPWPGTIYPGESYPTGDTGPYTIHPSDSEWDRVVGGGTIGLYVDGVLATPRTVEHHVTVTRGRSGATGNHSPQALTVRTVGLDDPKFHVGSMLEVRLDSAAINARLGYSLLSTVTAPRCAMSKITDLDQQRRRLKNTRVSAMTDIVGAGALAQFSRIKIPPTQAPSDGVTSRLSRLTPYSNKAGFLIDTNRTSRNSYVMQPKLLEGSLQSCLDAIAEACSGSFVEDRRGRVWWLDDFRPRPAAPAASINARYVPTPRWKQSVSDLCNSVLVTRTIDGKKALAGSAANQLSIDTYGLYEENFDSDPLQVVDNAQAIANDMVNARKYPYWRADKLTIDVLRMIREKQYPMAAAVLKLEIGDLIHINNIDGGLIPGFNNYNPLELWVEGMEERITPNEWTITIQTTWLNLHLSEIT